MVGLNGLREMNATGRLPTASSDNISRQEFASMRSEQERTDRLLMAGQQAMLDELRGIRLSNAAMCDLTEQQLARG